MAIYPASAPSILIVEDSIDDAALTARAIRAIYPQAELMIANDAMQALEFIEQTSSAYRLPNLVLLDLKLPGMNGLDLLRHIRGYAEYRTVPVVVLSSNDQESAICASYAVGANSYLYKPMDYHEYIETIGKALLYWLRQSRTTGWSSVTLA